LISVEQTTFFKSKTSTAKDLLSVVIVACKWIYKKYLFLESEKFFPKVAKAKGILKLVSRANPIIIVQQREYLDAHP
jgi:hypothetical protein